MRLGTGAVETVEAFKNAGLFSRVARRRYAFHPSEPMRRCVVAVPVRDEAQRLPTCLNALAAQRDKDGRPLVFGTFGVAIFANNCEDKSAELVRSLARGLPFAVRVVEASLLPDFAHAGGARREAMNQANVWLSERTECDGVILTTDADSQVSPNWIANNLAAIDAGADAVLGRVVLDEEGDLLPQALHHRGLLESVYETLLTELSALLDPVDYNPWPHHATISGATLAVTSEAYRQVGGLPCVPLGEDKALIAQLARIDARIRFCPDIEVTTSGRINGARLVASRTPCVCGVEIPTRFVTKRWSPSASH